MTKEIPKYSANGRMACLHRDNPTAKLVPQNEETPTETAELLRSQLQDITAKTNELGKQLENIEQESSENNRMLKELLGILNEPQSRRTLESSRPRTSPRPDRVSSPISRRVCAARHRPNISTSPDREPSPPLPPPPALAGWALKKTKGKSEAPPPNA